MRFDTFYFLVFVTCIFAAWKVLPYKGVILLVSSAVLYWLEAGNRDSALFLFLIVANFGLSLFVKGKPALFAAICLNVGALAFFKYRQFLAGDIFIGGPFINVAIPLGISFYTFQAMAYLIDIHRGQIDVERSIFRFALFKAFFPQLVAGPIVRAQLFLPQIKRQWSNDPQRRRMVIWGLSLVLAGLIKKVILADSLSPFVDDIFTNGPANAFTAWLGAALFAFQIYCDFSGYSDIAIGVAYLFWIRLPLNFRQPYLSASPREFWQRWHITLSTWIRDYLYIPLGGGKGGHLRSTIVVITVMAIAGLWHGANWTFAIWGLGWGIVIALWRVPFFRDIHPAIGWVLTVALALLLWVPFRAHDLSSALNYLMTMAGGTSTGTTGYQAWSLPAMAGLVALMLIHFAESKATGLRYMLVLRHLNGPLAWGILFAAITWILTMPKLVSAPFIYFRF